MKTRVIIYSALVLGLLFLYLRLSAPQRETEKRRSKQFAELIASNTPSSEVLTNPAYKKWEKPSNTSESDWQYATVIRQMMLATNKKIDYHARVIDQNGIGVAGAILEVEISGVDEQKVLREFPAMKMGSELFSEKIQLTSDSDGWIRLIDRRGTMVVVKDLQPGSGYIWQLKGYPSFDYKGNHELKDFQDPAKGYLVHLWKKGEPERVVPVSFGVSMNNTQQGQWVSNYFVSFIPARVEWTNFAGADLQIRGIRRMSGNPDRPFEFTFTLSLPDGGLALSGHVYPYQAPEQGYQTSWSFENKPHLNPPDFPWTKTAYLKLREGKLYAGLKIGFCNGGFDFSFKGYLNPTGSRNLEPDPEKLVTDPEEIRRIDEMTRVK